MKTVTAKFHNVGGVHPAYRKTVTAGLAIQPLPLSRRLVVPLSQHLGAPAKVLVKKGDRVLEGQPIGEPGGFVSAWIHAPAAGMIKAVDEFPAIGGRPVLGVEIESDGTHERHPTLEPIADWAAQPAKTLVAQIAKAGVVGMGGAGFPTHVKLSPPPNKRIDTLILNGAECEPYLTADHRLMLEQADRIAGGIAIIRHLLGARHVRVAIEDNKPDAIAAMEKALGALDGDVELVVLETEYPQGAEKQMIFRLLGREVPSGGLPMDVGAVVENVATAAAVRDAVCEGLPLTRRVVTVTGDGILSPRNLLAVVGTPLADLVAACGGLKQGVAKLICGGPMMGLAQANLEPGMTKTTSGLLALTRAATPVFESTPCIACSRCIGACPMALMPCTLSEFMEAEDYAAAEEYDVMDCIECGSCAFSCPAHRPLVQHMKQGKARVGALRRAREAQAKKAVG